MANNPAWTRITAIYSRLDSGESRAMYVKAENGNEYVAKGPSLTPTWRHVGANELIAFRLAERMGLPVLDCRVLQFEGELYVGHTRMQENQFHPYLTSELLARCSNLDRVYGLVVFDSWVCNTDRHEGNLLVRCSNSAGLANGRCAADEHTVLVNDHNRCLLPDNRETSHFSSLSGEYLAEFIQIGFIRDRIYSLGGLKDAIEQAERVSDIEISSIVNGVPPELLPDEDKAHWTEFLINRRGSLRRLFAAEHNRRLFRYLPGGSI
ncbi:MAG: hypothetical protein JNM56_20865 [Planctomycetia bacterium]|nr:hypothetical protein [Planctomycetia bacterium]